MDEIFAFQPGQIVFEESDPSDGFYIVKAGLVQIFRRVDSPEGKQEVELAQLGANEIFGEMGLVDLKGRSASCRALKPTIVNFVSYESFAQELFNLPPWHLSFVMTLARRLRNANNQITVATMAAKSANEQLLALRLPPAKGKLPQVKKGAKKLSGKVAAKGKATKGLAATAGLKKGSSRKTKVRAEGKTRSQAGSRSTKSSRSR